MRIIKLEIDTFEGTLRGYLWEYEEGEEPFCHTMIDIGSIKDFSKFKKWLDKIVKTLKQTSANLEENAGWGDFSMFRVVEKLEKLKNKEKEK